MKKFPLILSLCSALAVCLPVQSAFAAADVTDEIVQVADDNAFVPGDMNGDQQVTIADAIIMQNWLLSDPDSSMTNWSAGDLNHNNRIDVFDFVMLKQLLISNTSAPPANAAEKTIVPLLVIEEGARHRGMQNLLVFDENGTAYRRIFARGYVSYGTDYYNADVVDEDALIRLENDDWYDYVSDLLSRPNAVDDTVSLDDAILAESIEFAKNTSSYVDTPWLNERLHWLDGDTMNVYIIGNNDDDQPVIAKLATFLAYDVCRDNQDVQNYVMDLCKSGCLDITDADQEFQLYLDFISKYDQ